MTDITRKISFIRLLKLLPRLLDLNTTGGRMRLEGPLVSTMSLLINHSADQNSGIVLIVESISLNSSRTFSGKTQFCCTQNID